jgi:deoxyribonuclease-1
MHYPFRRDYQERFQICAQQTRAAGKGLWSDNQLSAAPAAQRDDTTPNLIRGNRRSKMYHIQSCPDYGTPSAKHIVPFTSEADARTAGYRKAGNCP